MKKLKKLFRGRKKKKREQQECWYNNSHEILDRGMAEIIPMDTFALSGESSLYIPTAKQLSH